MGIKTHSSVNQANQVSNSPTKMEESEGELENIHLTTQIKVGVHGEIFNLLHIFVSPRTCEHMTTSSRKQSGIITCKTLSPDKVGSDECLNEANLPISCLGKQETIHTISADRYIKIAEIDQEMYIHVSIGWLETHERRRSMTLRSCASIVKLL